MKFSTPMKVNESGEPTPKLSCTRGGTEFKPRDGNGGDAESEGNGNALSPFASVSHPDDSLSGATLLGSRSDVRDDHGPNKVLDSDMHRQESSPTVPSSLEFMSIGSPSSQPFRKMLTNLHKVVDNYELVAKENDNKLDDLNKNNAALRQELDSVTSKCGKLQGIQEEHENTIQTLKKESTTLKNELDESNVKVEALEGKCGELQVYQKMQANTIGTLKGEVTTLVEKNQDQAKEIESLKVRVQVMESHRDEALDELMREKTAVLRLSGQLTHSKNAIERITTSQRIASTILLTSISTVNDGN
ncbi:hypothetical protein ACHAWF_001658 [Thalassiosira exigua]